jgi:hypothetical protein
MISLYGQSFEITLKQIPGTAFVGNPIARVVCMTSGKLTTHATPKSSFLEGSEFTTTFDAVEAMFFNVPEIPWVIGHRG